LKTLLSIPRPESNGFIVWEHTLKTAVMFVGVFVMLFFGPMFLDARNRSGENGPGYYIITFLIENPLVQIGLSAFAALIYNIYTIFVNKKVQYVVRVDVIEDMAEIHLTNLYYSKLKVIQLPLADLSYVIDTKVTGDNEKRQKLKFNNHRTLETIGIIDTKHFFWADKLRDLKSMILALKALQVQKEPSPKYPEPENLPF
jgi:hypothetical protein